MTIVFIYSTISSSYFRWPGIIHSEPLPPLSYRACGVVGYYCNAIWLSSVQNTVIPIMVQLDGAMDATTWNDNFSIYAGFGQRPALK